MRDGFTLTTQKWTKIVCEGETNSKKRKIRQQIRRKGERKNEEEKNVKPRKHCTVHKAIFIFEQTNYSERACDMVPITYFDRSNSRVHR